MHISPSAGFWTSALVALSVISALAGAEPRAPAVLRVTFEGLRPVLVPTAP